MAYYTSVVVLLCAYMNRIVELTTGRLERLHKFFTSGLDLFSEQATFHSPPTSLVFSICGPFM